MLFLVRKWQRFARYQYKLLTYDVIVRESPLRLNFDQTKQHTFLQGYAATLKTITWYSWAQREC